MIEIYGLTKRYDGVVAVDSLSLTISSGAFFGFVGPNGAGKSTTINIATGIVRPTEGKVEICGIDLLQQPVEAKRLIGVVPSDTALFEGLTGKEHLEFVTKIRGLQEVESRGRMRELMNMLDLEGEMSRLIETYSTGMKRKLAFACAVIHRPRVLFMDEPFENVDPTSRKIMKEILLTMKKRGATIFLTSHSLDTVESLCDEVAIINKGRLVFQSKTEDIRKKIKNEVSQETYQSLEEVFLDVVSGNGQEPSPKRLSWL